MSQRACGAVRASHTGACDAEGCCGCDAKTSRFAKFLVPAVLCAALACTAYFVLPGVLHDSLTSKFVITGTGDSDFSDWEYFYAKVRALAVGSATFVVLPLPPCPPPVRVCFSAMYACV